MEKGTSRKQQGHLNAERTSVNNKMSLPLVRETCARWGRMLAMRGDWCREVCRNPVVVATFLCFFSVSSFLFPFWVSALEFCLVVAVRVVCHCLVRAIALFLRHVFVNLTLC